MKRKYLLTLSLITALLASTNALAQTSSTASKTLVVYFSRVGISPFSENVDVVTSASLNAGDKGLIGNTEIIAKMVQDAVGDDLFQIVTVKSYPENYRETTDVASQELGQNARPELAAHVENMADYDVIILCYPNWWGTIPMAVFTFLEEYDFSGKTIAPLCTHEGSRLGRSVADITKLCPQTTILEGLAIRGGSIKNAQNEVAEWLRRIGIIK